MNLREARVLNESYKYLYKISGKGQGNMKISMTTIKELFFKEKRDVGKYEKISIFVFILMINSIIHLLDFSLIRNFIVVMMVLILGCLNLIFVPLLENEAFFQVENRKKRFIVSSFIKMIILCIIGIVVYIMIFVNMFYRSDAVLKEDVDQYLTNKYKRAFVVTDEIDRRNSYYYVACYPKNNPEVKFLTIWKKGDLEKSRDTYLNSKWTNQAEPEIKALVKETYGKDTLMYFQLWTTNEGLLDISDEVKDMDYHEMIQKYKEEVSLDVDCYIFIRELDEKKESERAYNIVNHYLDKNAGDWRLHIYYFNENNKEDLLRQYETDHHFFRIKDTSDYDKMHKNNQLINMLYLHKGIKKDEIINHFYYK